MRRVPMHAIIDGAKPEHVAFADFTDDKTIRLRLVLKVVMDDGDVVPYESEPLSFRPMTEPGKK